MIACEGIFIKGVFDKCAFYSILLKVMINVLCMCTVWGEPLSQTAQSFMPELIYGANQNLTKVTIDDCVQIYADNKIVTLTGIDSDVSFHDRVSMCNYKSYFQLNVTHYTQ